MNVSESPSLHSHRGFAESIAAQSRLHDVIPGGAHTYARGADQYPDDMAPVLESGSAAHVWDLDGNCYVEYGMGLRSVTLGHAYPPVVDAVTEAARRGHNFSRPTVLEAEVAESFLDLVPTAEMVKFGKNGSDATSAGVKLARAHTGRDFVAVCRQPFFSTDDWFIGTTEMNAGIPSAYRDLTLPFSYNDLDSLRALFDAHPGRIACVVMEAATGTAEPEPGFLEGVRALCDDEGALLLFDEIITGFRWATGGAQSVYGVTPDLSSWGKAMGNGFAVSALAGKREYMERGGLRTDLPRAFLMSTTYGPETTSLAAMKAVFQTYREQDPVAVMEARGTALADGVNDAAGRAGLSDYLQVIGRPSCEVFVTRDADGVPSQAYRTLFLQELLTCGVLGQSFVISAAHTEADVDHTIAACEAAMVAYSKAIEAGTTDGLLIGRPVAPALRSLADPRRAW
ncbi:glutamate-1-semialdehyde 2,1-aminomutase [Rhodococcus sp. B10]|uniref:glutamate-1-semialdehyde 2,1-aminomutase n=1 Tax=Rhodococcus sp. B10 TaxID=2695876 RepID=UPI001431FACC|nr:glutamate-1-semialdehyde 2,1-aminomutase [Rhodococcus sp. B10]NIL74723.1 Glutamate-1-semialdehyde 2,1-aminomutase [Rhodococcus sp. B10]